LNTKKTKTLLLLYILIVSFIQVTSIKAISATAISKTIGQYGDKITVYGTGVVAGADVSVYWDNALKETFTDGSGRLNTTEAEPDGSFEINFFVPEASAGSHYIWVKDMATSSVDPDPIEFNYKIVSIELNPLEAYNWENITIIGTNFTEQTGVNLDFLLYNDTDEWDIDVLYQGSPVTTDENGSFTGYWQVPSSSDISSGQYLLNVTDFNGLSAQSPLYVTPAFVKISNFERLYSNNHISMVYPSDNESKPIDCGSASVSDWLASAFILSKLSKRTEGLDTDSAYVNQITGKPLGDYGTGVISFGGVFVNPVVKYSELDTTPLEDRAPIKFFDEEDYAKFKHRNGTDIPGAELPWANVNNDKDIFVIEVFKDNEDRYIMLCYGFGWKGTYAAGKYFDDVIYPNLDLHPYSWMIVKWEDTNNNGFVNLESDGDTYTLISFS
jgi:hypothetical protein